MMFIKIKHQKIHYGIFFLFSGHGQLVYQNRKENIFDLLVSRTFSDQKKNVTAVSFEILAACQTLTM